MKKHIVLDTQEILICDACQLPIPISADKIVYGVGGAAYVKIYHRRCDPTHLAATFHGKQVIVNADSEVN